GLSPRSQRITVQSVLRHERPNRKTATRVRRWALLQAQGGPMPVYLGIDWSQNKHDLCFVNAAGAAIARATIPHSAEGFLELDRLREKIGLPAAECWVGLETCHH